RSGCCSDLFLGDHPILLKCMMMHSSNMPDPDDLNMEPLMKFFSCLIECFYKKSKYIGKGDTLNMKMVKLDAEHLYAERPKERDYYIRVMDDCNKKISREFGMLKNSPALKALFKNSCRPFFTLIFVCYADYHQKHSCPYFRWSDLSEDEHQCKDAKEKCYEMDGLEVPVDIFA
ncbi:hypothetical protein KR222_002805, partial [Zaprionus bogoriensis]